MSENLNKYIAHKRDDGVEQSVINHLEGTAEIAAGFASDFDCAEQGNLVGIAHDIGKYSKEFQRRIKDNGPKVDHSTAGAYLCAKNKQNYAAFCIAGHHSGLPDLGGRDDTSENTLLARMNKANNGMIPDFSSWKEELKGIPEAHLPLYKTTNKLSESFFTRMLFSCLVDADYLDTERFMKEGLVERGCNTSFVELKNRIDEHINKWFPPKGKLNTARCAILQNCIEKSSMDQGLFTLTVPTGGGKTVASLAFAVNHAISHGLKRIIYVIPYTSIIDQTAEVFRKILGNDVVLEHHSNVEYDQDDLYSDTAIEMSLATENWDMPVVVTTAVQFFESMFANKSSKCRKIHNISKSVVIFDEAQMLPIPYLRPCLYVISELVKFYHVSAVLCTATQPSIGNILKEFFDNYSLKEICPKDTYYSDAVFKRAIIDNRGDMTWQEVAQIMKRHHQVLCIVNSRKSAKELYDSVRSAGTYHLSTLMIPEERKKILSVIRERLKEGAVCRVVSTSLIEAGVDVDFPCVMRELAGLDSIMQAAGRCNREAKRPAEESAVIVFKTDGHISPLFSANISACKYAMRTNDRIDSEESIKCYFDNLYDLKGEEAFDKNNILELLENSRLRFKEAARRFHLIDNDTVTIYIPIGEGKELIERRRMGEVSKALLRKLGRYSVSVYTDHFKSLYEAGDIEQIGVSEWALSNTSVYSYETGLSLEADGGKAIFV